MRCGCHTRLHRRQAGAERYEYAALEKAREKSEKTGKRDAAPPESLFDSNGAAPHENFGLMDRDVNSAKLIRGV
jgi:hypothetical protein